MDIDTTTTTTTTQLSSSSSSPFSNASEKACARWLMLVKEISTIITMKLPDILNEVGTIKFVGEHGIEDLLVEDWQEYVDVFFEQLVELGGKLQILLEAFSNKDFLQLLLGVGLQGNFVHFRADLIDGLRFSLVNAEEYFIKCHHYMPSWKVTNLDEITCPKSDKSKQFGKTPSAIEAADDNREMSMEMYFFYEMCRIRTCLFMVETCLSLTHNNNTEGIETLCDWKYTHANKMEILDLYRVLPMNLQNWRHNYHSKESKRSRITNEVLNRRKEKNKKHKKTTPKKSGRKITKNYKNDSDENGEEEDDDGNSDDRGLNFSSSSSSSDADDEEDDDSLIPPVELYDQHQLEVSFKYLFYEINCIPYHPDIEIYINALLNRMSWFLTFPSTEIDLNEKEFGAEIPEQLSSGLINFETLRNRRQPPPLPPKICPNLDYLYRNILRYECLLKKIFPFKNWKYRTMDSDEMEALPRFPPPEELVQWFMDGIKMKFLQTDKMMQENLQRAHFEILLPPGDREWLHFRHPLQMVNDTSLLTVLHPEAKPVVTERASTKALAIFNSPNHNNASIYEYLVVTTLEMIWAAYFKFSDCFVLPERLILSQLQSMTERKMPCLVQCFNRYLVLYKNQLFSDINIYAAIARLFNYLLNDFSTHSVVIYMIEGMKKIISKKPETLVATTTTTTTTTSLSSSSSTSSPSPRSTNQQPQNSTTTKKRKL
jgi:hypothetical protein